MKSICINLTLFLAGGVLAGAVQAQDKAALSHLGDSSMATTASAPLEMKIEPKLAWGSRTQVTGLFVDLIKPQQTWAMLNPPPAARDALEPIPHFLLPVTAPLPISEAAIHAEPDFALLRFSFR